MQRILSIGAGLVVVVLVGYLVFGQKQAALAPTVPEVQPLEQSPATGTDAPAVVPPREEKPTATTPTTPAAEPLTLAVVATHASRTSCWSAINGTVYDLTSWIPQHPGGEAGILKLCGVDGSARYNAQHGGGAKQAAVLRGFAIGPLAP